VNWARRKVLVIGLGKSGEAAAEKLAELQAEVTACDHDAGDAVREKVSRLERIGVRVKLGPDFPKDLGDFDLLVISPGVPEELAVVENARKIGVPVWSEIELAFHLTGSPIIGITGTNGKTTTTRLIGEVFKRAGIPAVVAGNIGFPLVKSLEKAGRDSWLITELSSFQLQNIWRFSPRIGLLLNVTEDHMDRHTSFQQYAEAKTRLFSNQKREDFAVLNLDDRVVRELIPRVRARVIPFSALGPNSQPGIYVREGKIVSTLGKRQVVICGLAELKLRGIHNVENSLASVGVCLAAGIGPEVIAETLRSFEGLEHRCEYVTEIRGVAYYNDSKATNPDATIKALSAFEGPLILLLGGRNKGNSFVGLAEAVGGRTRAVVLFGESASEIKTLLKDKEIVVEEANTMEEVVAKAHGLSRPGDVVLLSPASASFDMFSDYEERGRAFKEAVKKLKKM
jgi:UDP-N-acetylmuramoylalanine--D-glutamate ligase